ncbi:MAG: signal peptidase I [Opitutaceae bacterium]
MKSVLRSLWREWIKPAALFFLVMAPLRSAVVDWNWVPTGSMKPTIMVGDLVFVNKLAYDLKVPFTRTRISTWAEPSRGDIAVLFSPSDGKRLVKRVIGLPGDTIEMRRDVLFVNGIQQGYSIRDSRPYLRDIPESANPVIAVERLGEREHLIAVLPDRAAMRTFGPFLVPMDHYFVMGDSRDNSEDSRYFGTVARQSIVGRATLVLCSFDLSHYFAPRFARFFKSLNPDGA